MRVLWWGSPGFLGSVLSSGAPSDPEQGAQSGSTLGWGAGGAKEVKEPDPNTAQPGAPCAGDKDKPGGQGVPGCWMGTFEEPPISPNSHGLKHETPDLSIYLGAPQPQRCRFPGATPGWLQIPSAPSSGGGGRSLRILSLFRGSWRDPPTIPILSMCRGPGAVPSATRGAQRCCRRGKLYGCS